MPASFVGAHVRASWARCDGLPAGLKLEGDISDGVIQGIVIKVATVGLPIAVVASTSFGDVIRVGTYNVQFLPSSVFLKPLSDADHIAARIKDGNYDVIALNEVFDEEARNVFIQRLGPAYPHRITKLYGSANHQEDSGLMLFSRFPFAPLPQPNDFQVNTGVTSTNFGAEEVYLMGDLNVDGDPADADKGFPASPNNSWEWKDKFGTPGRYFHDTLRDAWSADTSPDDRGLTNLIEWGSVSDSGARLDYILRKTTSRLCTLHITRSYNLQWGDPYIESGLGEPDTEAGATNLSDHFGVTADIGPDAPYCRASQPNVQQLVPGQAKTVSGVIPYAAGMH